MEVSWLITSTSNSNRPRANGANVSKESKQRRNNIRRDGLSAIFNSQLPQRILKVMRWDAGGNETKQEDWQHWKQVSELLRKAGYWSHNPGVLGEFTLETFLEETSHDPEFWDEEARAVWSEIYTSWWNVY